MRLVIALLALTFALPIFAVPAPTNPTHQCDRKKKRNLRKRCSITGCIQSLASVSAPCLAAASEEGLNPSADAECIIGIGEAVDTFDECTSCFPDISVSDVFPDIVNLLNEPDSSDGDDEGDQGGEFGGGGFDPGGDGGGEGGDDGGC
ncbi:hypothetical protein BD410DRAFT_44844 [Rickenella mellea]|uniref:Fungal calcium binding protein domain-containing protein n=1 Tax=Rickenella mellea TaxID=50990 RepID=A0A4R5XGE3_9AGAM|nr:hypothetical protein BD410DRAFT_44844 [Rickenella mellea]